MNILVLNIHVALVNQKSNHINVFLVYGDEDWRATFTVWQIKAGVGILLQESENVVVFLFDRVMHCGPVEIFCVLLEDGIWLLLKYLLNESRIISTHSIDQIC